MPVEVTIIQIPSEDTIDAAAEHIRQLDRTYCQRYAVEVGKYLLDSTATGEVVAAR